MVAILKISQPARAIFMKNLKENRTSALPKTIWGITTPRKISCLLNKEPIESNSDELIQTLSPSNNSPESLSAHAVALNMLKELKGFYAWQMGDEVVFLTEATLYSSYNSNCPHHLILAAGLLKPHPKSSIN